MSDNTFDEEKTWENVNSTRPKMKKWAEKNPGKDPGEAMVAGVTKSPWQVMKEGFGLDDDEEKSK
jgi:hypothetical protein